MENSENKPSTGSSCKSTHCHSTKFALGLLTGVAVSFVLAFAFITIFAGDLLRSTAPSDAVDPPTAAPTQQVSVDETILAAAKKANLDVNELQTCLDEDRFKEAVQEESEMGVKAGVSGTPNNIIISKYGMTQVSGALPIENLKPIIDAHLDGSIEETQDVALDPVTQEDWIRGDANAPVSIVEYSDIDCPFCKRHHPTLKQIVEEYDDQVNWVYRHFPLDRLHPDARRKAEATECAGEQGGNDAFWNILDTLSQ